SFAIADGIQPGNTDRNYVLRRILRRAVRYGRTLGFAEPFFYKLVATLAREMGGIFPNIRERQKHVEEVLKREEEAFNRTLDRGLELFTNIVAYKNALRSELESGRLNELLSAASRGDKGPFRDWPGASSDLDVDDIELYGSDVEDVYRGLITC